ncbi:MAG: SagB/ThcOx family dehydrogenase [Desulfurococcales archaeon]|nr:SagB/ThcOx family dehydrogenase [Desulfurococcales archaeon]
MIDLLRKLAGVYAKRALEALRRASERRDPSVFYHILSNLEPNYYGWSVKVPHSFPKYYKKYSNLETVNLPPPLESSGTDTLAAIRIRRSRRRYTGPLSLEELSTVLYYSIGVTGWTWWGGPKRAYPSAGALQPVEGYVVAGEVEDLEPGTYYYSPSDHKLKQIDRGDARDELYKACLDQEHVKEAPASIIFTAYYPRTASRYQVRAYRYTLLDVGFAGENVYLVAEALGLATVAVGAFYDNEICRIIHVDCEWELPMLVFPLGRRTDSLISFK